MTNLTADLAYWIQERHSIKLRREQGAPKPWSPDRIFQRVRFCNVHREDDAVTIWIRQNWNKSDDPAWKFVLARMINLTESLQDLLHSSCGPGGFLEQYKRTLKERREAGEKVFTSAYTISTCGKSMDKLDYVFDWVVKAVMEAGEPDNDTCQETWDNLTQIDGLGSFLAAQVVADMKNTVEHPLSDAPDFWTFSKPGPGSLRGLSWYFYGGPEGAKTSSYAHLLKVCRKEVDPLIASYIPRISDQDFQNCLCEFSKYMKVKNDPNAHVRNHYPGV